MYDIARSKWEKYINGLLDCDTAEGKFKLQTKM